MISAKFAGAVGALALVALVPTVIHSYLGRLQDDGRRVERLPQHLAGMASIPTGRDAGWGKRRFDSDDWIERHYLAPDGRRLKLFAGRSYDAKKLYHHPEIDIARGTSFQSASVERVESLPGVPLHVLRASEGGRRDLVVYVLHYGDRFVENPFTFQLRLAGESLVGGRKPMTLFFVQTAAGEADLEGAATVALLGEAIRSFLSPQPAAS
jgi:hypothetical protein